MVSCRGSCAQQPLRLGVTTLSSPTAHRTGWGAQKRGLLPFLQPVGLVTLGICEPPDLRPQGCQNVQPISGGQRQEIGQKKHKTPREEGLPESQDGPPHLEAVLGWQTVNDGWGLLPGEGLGNPGAAPHFCQVMRRKHLSQRPGKQVNRLHRTCQAEERAETWRTQGKYQWVHETDGRSQQRKPHVRRSPAKTRKNRGPGRVMVTGTGRASLHWGSSLRPWRGGVYRWTEAGTCHQGPLSRRQAGRTQSRPPPHPTRLTVCTLLPVGGFRGEKRVTRVFPVPVHPGRPTVGWTGTSCDPRSQPLAGHPLQAHWSPSSGSCSFLSPLRGPVGQCGVRWGAVGQCGVLWTVWGPVR